MTPKAAPSSKPVPYVDNWAIRVPMSWTCQQWFAGVALKDDSLENVKQSGSIPTRKLVIPNAPDSARMIVNSMNDIYGIILEQSPQLCSRGRD